MKCNDDRSLLDIKKGEEGVHVVLKMESPALFFSAYLCMLKSPAELQGWSFNSSKAEFLTGSLPVFYIIDVDLIKYITYFFLLFTTHTIVIVICMSFNTHFDSQHQITCSLACKHVCLSVFEDWYDLLYCNLHKPLLLFRYSCHAQRTSLQAFEPDIKALPELNFKPLYQQNFPFFIVFQ